MSYMPLEHLINDTDSIYKLVVVAGKRARQLSEGAPRLVVSDSTKLSTIALEEIREGAVLPRTQLAADEIDTEASAAEESVTPEESEDLEGVEETPQVAAQ